MYSFIDQDCWEELVNSHTTLEFLAKGKKGKLNRYRNVYPYRLKRQRLKKKETKGNKS